MSSEKQKAASRANGVLSRGPKTPEGKARSSRNTTRHGLLSRIVVLEEEPDKEFRKICREYARRFGPLDGVEADMVDEMVVSLWRLRRAWAIENRYFDTAMAAQQGPCATDRLMSAFTDLTENNRLNLLHRYETRLHTMFQRAFKNLLALRKQAPLITECAPVPNEPKKSPDSNKFAHSEPESHPNLPPAEPVFEAARHLPDVARRPEARIHALPRRQISVAPNHRPAAFSSFISATPPGLLSSPFASGRVGCTALRIPPTLSTCFP